MSNKPFIHTKEDPDNGQEFLEYVCDSITQYVNELHVEYLEPRERMVTNPKTGRKTRHKILVQDLTLDKMGIGYDIPKNNKTKFTLAANFLSNLFTEGANEVIMGENFQDGVYKNEKLGEIISNMIYEWRKRHASDDKIGNAKENE